MIEVMGNSQIGTELIINLPSKMSTLYSSSLNFKFNLFKTHNNHQILFIRFIHKRVKIINLFSSHNIIHIHINIHFNIACIDLKSKTESMVSFVSWFDVNWDVTVFIGVIVFEWIDFVFVLEVFLYKI